MSLSICVVGCGEQAHKVLDCSAIEVFANGKLCLTTRIYPSRDDSLGTAAFAHGGSATLQRMDAWELAPRHAAAGFS